MIIGAHSIIYSKDPDADRAFLRDVLGLPNVDVGDGWLIFGLPPAEVAVHPSDENGVHEFYFMSDDIQGFIRAMQKRRIACAPPQNLGWGVLTQVTLPGGGQLGIYEPRHARPKPMGSKMQATDAKTKPRKTTPRGVKSSGQRKGTIAKRGRARARSK